MALFSASLSFFSHLTVYRAGLRLESKEAFEEYKREYLARRNGEGKAQVDLANYPACLDDLPVTEADRNVWRKRIFGAIRDFSQIENQDRRKGQKANTQ
ncbi:hypothetical protein QBC32DRAFT_318366, partial [Pseudoneurospora amorphoporcata]